jgi:hypothetical protein
MELHIANKNEISLQKLIAFNAKIYPEKKIPAEDYLKFWFSKSEDELAQGVYLVDGNGEIHGQILTSGMSYYYKGSVIDTVWLYDLIVEEVLRKDSWGVDVIVSCFDKHPASCSTGSGPDALKLHLKLGNKQLAEIRKYVGVANPLWIATSVFRGNIAVNKFPQQVNVDGHTFVKTKKENLPELKKPYNDNMWEPARDSSYLQWRFFNDLHEYAFYKDNQSEDYFTVRTIIQSHVTAMLLVDYRCDATGKKCFERIYKAVSKVMSKLHLAVLITGSTLATIDSVLEEHHFKSVGRPRPVIGFLKVKDRKTDIDDRNFAFVTLADSDGETNWL